MKNVKTIIRVAIISAIMTIVTVIPAFATINP